MDRPQPLPPMLRSILEARMALDPGMAELAATTATDDDLAAMADELAAMDAHRGRYPAWNAAYNAYWRLLAASTANPLLASLSPALRAIVNSGGFVPDERHRGEIATRLRTLHEAVAGRDPEAARAAMLDLDRSFRDRLAEGYPELHCNITDLDRPPHPTIMFFESMIEPENREHLSEDYAFCRRWRDLGGEIWADFQTRMGHVGHATYSGSLLDAVAT